MIQTQQLDSIVLCMDALLGVAHDHADDAITALTQKGQNGTGRDLTGTRRRSRRVAPSFGLGPTCSASTTGTEVTLLLLSSKQA